MTQKHTYRANSLNRKWCLVWVLFCCLVSGGMAQAPAHYAQYLFNGLAINPAYCGGEDALAASLLYRGQWQGVPGAPRTFTAAVHTPTPNRRNGFGMTLVEDQLGITHQQWIMGNYAFRFKTGKAGKGEIALGLQGGVSLHSYNFNALYLEDIDDPNFQPLTRPVALPEFGFGALFNSPHFFMGFSVPGLLQYKTDAYKQSFPGEEDSPNFFFNSGVRFKLQPGLEFKPSMLVKYKPSLPTQVDVNAQFLYNERWGFGVSYRTQDAIVGLVEAYPMPQFRIGYAYEYGMNPLNPWNRGTHELMLSYKFKYFIRSQHPRVW